MNKALSLIGAIGVGALAMYYLDPKQGDKRRAQARDKASEMSSTLQDMAQGAMQDVADRSKGLASDARSLFNEARSHLPSTGDKLSRAQSLMHSTVSTPGRKAATAATGLSAGILGMVSHSVLSRYPLFMLALGLLGYVAANSRRDIGDQVAEMSSDAVETGKDLARPVIDTVSQRAGSMLQ